MRGSDYVVKRVFFALATVLVHLPRPCFLRFRLDCVLEGPALRELAAAVARLDVVVLAAEEQRPLLQRAGFQLGDVPRQRSAPVQ